MLGSRHDAARIANLAYKPTLIILHRTSSSSKRALLSPTVLKKALEKCGLDAYVCDLHPAVVTCLAARQGEADSKGQVAVAAASAQVLTTEMQFKILSLFLGLIVSANVSVALCLSGSSQL